MFFRIPSIGLIKKSGFTRSEPADFKPSSHDELKNMDSKFQNPYITGFLWTQSEKSKLNPSFVIYKINKKTIQILKKKWKENKKI